jgi:hypothetical protein
VRAAWVGYRGQYRLLLTRAVLDKQFPQLLRPDAALPGLDPADLGPVTLQDSRRVIKREAQVLAIPAKRPAHEPPPYRRYSDHDDHPSVWCRSGDAARVAALRQNLIY